MNSDTADASNPNTSPLCGPDCQKQRSLAAAQQAYQTALANKDTDPTTYQLMRYRYFSLKEGPEWAQKEKARIAQTDINPVIDKLRQSYQQVNGQFQSQRDLVEAVDILQRQQEASRKDTEQQVKLLEDDLEEKRAKIGVYNRSVDFAPVSATTTLDPLIRYFSGYPSSFQTILDVTIGIVLFLVFVLIVSRVRSGGETRSAPPNVGKAVEVVKDAVAGNGVILALVAALIALTLVIVYAGSQ